MKRKAKQNNYQQVNNYHSPKVKLFFTILEKIVNP